MERLCSLRWPWAVALGWLLVSSLAIAGEPGIAADVANPGEASWVQQPAGEKPPPVVLPEVKAEAARIPPEPPSPPPLPALPTFPFAPVPVPGYRAGSAVTGTGIVTPLLNVPASVDVVPRAVIADQQALRTEDLLRNVAGAAVTPSGITRLNQFTLRGFKLSDFELRRNGFVDFSIVPRELANIERVEFLKGPAAILYGGGQPGGVVNFITRMPLTQRAGSAELQLGSFDLYRFVGDATGPVGSSDSLYYRGIVALEDSGSFRDFGYMNRVLAAPSLTWAIDHDTTLTFLPEFLHTDLFWDTGLVAPGGVVGTLPISRSFNEPNDFWRENDYRVAMFLDHRINENWAVRLAGQASWFPGEVQRTLPVALVSPDTLLRVKQHANSANEQFHSIIAALTGNVTTGPLKHQLLFGTELLWFVVPDFVLKQSNPFVTPLLLNIFNPVYENAAFGAPDPPLPFTVHLNEDQTRYGFYAQDLIAVGRHWQVLLGARYDIVHNQFEETSNVPLGFPVGGIFPLAAPRYVRTDPTYYHWSPRAGVVWQPVPEILAMYGSYSQSFNPVFGPRSDGGALVPETGYQWEGGLKADLLDGKLSVTAAGFYIVKSNVAVPDPAVDFFFFQQVGQERSQGAELGMVGNLTESWSIIANYAYVDTEVTQDSNPTLLGKRFLSVPLGSGNVWTRYNVIQRADQTFGLAAGLVGVGERPGDLANSFTLPAYARWDAGVFYQRRHLSISLYFENLFDIDYYAGSVSAFQVFPGAPFNVRGSLRWAF